MSPNQFGNRTSIFIVLKEWQDVESWAIFKFNYVCKNFIALKFINLKLKNRFNEFKRTGRTSMGKPGVAKR
jgi:hypothetical protein